MNGRHFGQNARIPHRAIEETTVKEDKSTRHGLCGVADRTDRSS